MQEWYVFCVNLQLVKAKRAFVTDALQYNNAPCNSQLMSCGSSTLIICKGNMPRSSFSFE